MAEKVIGWLAPPYCVVCRAEGSALCVSCRISEIVPFGEQCWRCSAVSSGGKTCGRCRQAGSPMHVWITTSYSKAAKELVTSFKFGHLRQAAGPMASLMAETYLRVNELKGDTPREYLLVPVPSASSRRRQRSFGHAELLARRLSTLLGYERKHVLGRRGQTRQVGAKRPIRLKQPAGMYFVRKPGKIQGKNILLVDDVLTTGATLQEAAKQLRQAGAIQVDALVFAKRL